jgi:ABC-type Zn2+ transport system substrate-binding protein/surface adhesin
MHDGNTHHHHHEHEHEHDHGLTHSHEHSHDEGHDHEHNHDHTEVSSRSQQQLAAVLGYMLEHNRSHADELAETASRLKTLGIEAAAADVEAAVKSFGEGNDKLEAALALLK